MKFHSLALAMASFVSGDIVNKNVARVTLGKNGDGTANANVYTDYAETSADGDLELDCVFRKNAVVLFGAQKEMMQMIGNERDQAFNLFHALPIGGINEIASGRKVSQVDVTYASGAGALVYTKSGVRSIDLTDFASVEVKGDKLIMVRKDERINTFNAQQFFDKLSEIGEEMKTATAKLNMEKMQLMGLAPITSIHVPGAKKLAAKYNDDGKLELQVFGDSGLLGVFDTKHGKLIPTPQAADVDTFQIALSDGSGRNANVTRRSNGDIALAAAA